MTHIDQQGLNLNSGPNFLPPNHHCILTFWLFDLMSSLVWWKAEINNGPCSGYEADSINLMLALTSAGFLAGASGIRVGQGTVHLNHTRGRKDPGFSWATFGWASSIIDTFDTFVSQKIPLFSLRYNLPSVPWPMFGSISCQPHPCTLHQVHRWPA